MTPFLAISYMFWPFVIPSSLYTNNYDNNSNRALTLKKKLKFSNGIMWKNMRTNLGSKTTIDDTMVVDSTIMTTCMSSFSNPLLDFDSMLVFLTFTNMFFFKYCSCISIWGNLTLKVIVIKVALSNKSQYKYAACIFHVSICNSIRGAIPIEHLCFKCNNFNSKIQITHCNN